MVFQRYPNKRAIISLLYEYVQFENSTLKNHWYKGVYNIAKLGFEACIINCIEADAFNVAAFANLTAITFHWIDGVVTLAPFSFNELKTLKGITFHATQFNELQKDFLRSFNNVLQHFTCIPLEQNIGIADFFGGPNPFVRMRGLTIIHVVSTAFATLAPNNFSNLPILVKLHLENCGIEWISEHTFVPIAQTLEWINLSRNRLQSIAPAIFRIFSARFQNINALCWVVDENCLVCNCDHYLSENVAMMDIHAPIDLRRKSTCKQGSTAHNDNMCPGLQQLHTEKMCLKLLNLGSFSYPRFRLRLNRQDNSISVRTNITGSYKIIVESVKLKRKCNDKWWRMEHIKCIAINESNVEIPLSNWFSAEVVKISIGYLVHGWPLSFVTIRMVHENGYAYDSIAFLLLDIFLNILAFGVGFTITMCKEHKR